MKRISLLVFTVLIFLIMNACNPKENVDLIVVNATVYTVDENFSKTQSFTVRGGEIVATGTSDEIQKKYATAETINAEGKFIYLGFNDAHCHFNGYGTNLMQYADLRGTESPGEIYEILKEHYKKYGGEWVLGRNWDQNDWGLDKKTILLMDKMQQNGSLKMRINAMLNPTDENLKYFVKNGRIKKERLTVNTIKIYADGALGSRGALLLADYSDDPGNSGLQIANQEYYDNICEIAYNNNFVVATHCTSDMAWAGSRLGEERIKGAYPYQTLLNQLGWLPNGTDLMNASPQEILQTKILSTWSGGEKVFELQSLN